MSNPAMPKLVKIGKTARDPRERLKELSNTSVPTEFALEYFALVDSFDAVEREVHVILQNARPFPDREFFSISIAEAVEVIRAFTVIKEFMSGDCGTTASLSGSITEPPEQNTIPDIIDWQARRQVDREVMVRGRKIFVPGDKNNVDGAQKRQIAYVDGKWQFVKK